MPNVKPSEEASPGAIDHCYVVKHGVSPGRKDICMANLHFCTETHPIFVWLE